MRFNFFPRPGLAGVLGAVLGAAQSIPSPAACTTPDFLAPRRFATHGDPRGLVVADFNRDSHPDVAVALHSIASPSGPAAGGVTLLMGAGDGTFRVQTNYPVASRLSALAAGDFNRDGALDLALGADVDPPSDSVFLLMGNPDGTFQPPAAYAAGPRVLSLAAADFDSDGLLDLAAANYGETGTLSILRGTGGGALGPARTLPTGSGPISVGVGDFDADGKPDLALTTVRGVVAVLPGTGEGTFGPGINQQMDTALGELRVGDFNGDRRPDIAALGSTSGDVLVWMGNGDGTLRAPIRRSVEGSARSIAVGDVNRDTIPDLVLPLPPVSGVATWRGLGDGTFEGAAAPDAAVSGASVVEIADLNHDGAPDLAVAGLGPLGESGVSILRGRGDGTWRTLVDDPPRGSDASLLALALADLTGDGHGDLVQFSSQDLVVSRGLGTGEYTRPPTNQVFKTAVQHVATGDLNGDGVADLATLSPSPTPVTAWITGSKARFASVRSYAAGPEPAGLAIHDFNRDGSPDLAMVDASTGTLSLLQGSPAGTFRPGFSGPAGSLPNSITLADFNQDGFMDAAVAGRDGVGFLRGTGEGSFAEPSLSPAGWFPWAITSADFNRDEKPDVALLTRTEPGGSAVAAVLLGDGAGAFGAPAFLEVGSEPYSVLAGDLDQDGDPDLAVGNYGSGSVSILANRADGTFSPAAEYHTTAHAVRVSPVSPQLMALADLDEDGRPDLLVGNMGTGRTAMLLNRCTEAASAVALSVSFEDSGVVLSWPPGSGLVLESASRLSLPDWQPVPETPSTLDGRSRVRVPADARERFFRLAPAPPSSPR